MRYSIEPRERRYVTEYGFLSFARNLMQLKSLQIQIIDMVKILLILLKKSATDTLKIAN